jgi:hypothetical protein
MTGDAGETVHPIVGHEEVVAHCSGFLGWCVCAAGVEDKIGHVEGERKGREGREGGK